VNKEIHNQSKDPKESIKMEAKSSVSKDKESKDRKQETKKESPQEEIALLKNQLLRSMADMENLRKRFSKELEDKLKYYNADFIEKLLPVFDNLERALRSIPQDEVKKNKLLNNLFIGIGAIQKEISAVFERFQISKISPLGEPFDHNLHEAMFEVQDSDKADGTVVEVIEVGYLLYDRLIRPAKVGIAKKQQSNMKNSEEKKIK
tara:strand:- start:495 stop:1109 length:615 start_codon:yes stop_codon:yes gene_type:complete